ncbi:hypothetical protein A2276_03445 [candidate division WOR-1 bacterium RIFOXYA12_FULL_43_27]|uniref:Uncharacterized protein n=1 Tax=candidate division WOR-1 bacterium RIFOXYC2_FULL_46_14 TaxID=1802587 RepID=A0A1F4U798_UNCSA|nr:MAG: hypothetical protein A2276_03445 [candidate division WOR-1 bacterium RIFOXYA12_FULL_43_27]OGC19246.1 MAG: hypothetical protein A2292_00890 [candidate division WOR-1 bacterium RIFOXYB2_FULL_46_45]OGC30235.1 MAG: hypothetical protein A2232_00890 [candidate division WOR-1 bacterium RIFOXYA2_FULL_46_56]OGC40836.1 MAG: hypothetical protein A2438_00890 [candidate division WOR-1 bacterium RIFOXYC2_FULL_46_14]
MPGGDGTGPRGGGPGTGWGRGPCGRKGFGRGFFGWFRRGDAKQDLESLRAEKREIEKEIAELEGGNK